MSLTLYRTSKIGSTLTETVKDLKDRNKITEKLADKILESFDKVIINIYLS
jgi:hypothetical protein